jgi:hypothetical protein
MINITLTKIISYLIWIIIILSVLGLVGQLSIMRSNDIEAQTLKATWNLRRHLFFPWYIEYAIKDILGIVGGFLIIKRKKIGLLVYIILSFIYLLEIILIHQKIYISPISLLVLITTILIVISKTAREEFRYGKPK